MPGICLPLFLRRAAPRGSIRWKPARRWASPRRQHSFNLRPGSTAVFYSDGLVENRNRGLDAGLEELAAVAGRADADVLARPERLLEYLVDRMLAGHEQDDDVTVLVAHVPVGGPR